MGIAAGFRPSSLLLLCPLLLFSIRNATRKQATVGVGALVLTLLAWFSPMIEIGGGAAYASSLVSLWLNVPSRGTVFNSTVVNCLVRLCAIAGIYVLCFGSASILPFRHVRDDSLAGRRKTIFTWVWLAPGLLFFVLIYLKFVNSGYCLVLVPPVCAWMGMWASAWYANLRMSGTLKVLVVGGCALANAAVFIYAPVYCSYGEVRRFETELKDIIAILPQLASPEETMIVGFDSHFLGYRHAGYYLPDYLTVQFPAVQLAAGTRVFTMNHRNTKLESSLSGSPMRSFILFPLPCGDSEYSDYLAQVLKRFPLSEVRVIVRGCHEFVIGPVMDLHLLFPVSTGQAIRPASTARLCGPVYTTKDNCERR
jgi:hypothetical protein